MIFSQGHAVTLTFKRATLMLCATCCLNMAIISVKKFKNPTSNKKLWAGHNFASRSCCDLSDSNVACAYCTQCYLCTYQVSCA